MRHPALTRFFAAFLAVVSAITIISGGICVKKASDTHAKQQSELALLSDRWTEATAVFAELEDMRAEYETLDSENTALRDAYSKEMISFRKDLAIYTATEAGLKQGAEQLEEGIKGVNLGWVAYYKGAEALEEAEEQFKQGYEQFLAGKAALADGWQKYYLAEEYVSSGADIEAQSALIAAASAMSRSLSASMAALEDTLNDPPLDPETGEIDREALGAALAEQSEALLAAIAESEELRDGAQAAFDRASRFVEANAATLQDLLERGFSPEEVSAIIDRQGAQIRERLESVQQLVGELDGAEETAEELKARLEELRDNAETIAQGDLSDSELVMTLSAMLGTMRSLLDDASSVLDGAGQLMELLGDLPAMKAQLEAAQAAIDENEPMLEAAREGFELGYEKLAETELMLINAGWELEKGKQAMEEKQLEQKDTRAELDRRKSALEENSQSLAEQDERLALYNEKNDHFSNLRYALLANDGVSSRVRGGEELLPAAEAEIAAEAQSSEREVCFRMAAAGLMLAAGLFGVIAVVLVFRDKAGAGLLLSTALAFALTAAAEAVSYAAGRGMIYTVLFVGVFAAAIAALNLKKE